MVSLLRQPQVLLAAPWRRLCPPHPSRTDLCQLAPVAQNAPGCSFCVDPALLLPAYLLVRLFILEGIPSVLLGIAMLVSVLLGSTRSWWRPAS